MSYFGSLQKKSRNACKDPVTTVLKSPMRWQWNVRERVTNSRLKPE